MCEILLNSTLPLRLKESNLRIVISWAIQNIMSPILVTEYEQLRSQYGFNTGRTLTEFRRETLVIANNL